MNRPPIRLTEQQVAKFPRWALTVILAAYALPGLFDRDPWRADDAIGFGVMWTMVNGVWRDWLLPNVAGLPFYDDGPLFYWAGALLIRLFGRWIEPDELARVVSLIAMTISAISIWYATYLLGRRAETQPQQFAFGGHPRPQDYGRVLADGALLVAVATLGLLLRAHESSAEIGQFAATCALLLALVRALDKPVQGALLFGVSAAALALTRNFAALVMPAVTLLVFIALSRDMRAQALRFVPIAAIVAVVPLAAWWWAVDRLPDGPRFRAEWFDQAPLQAWIARPSTWLYYLRNLLWFVWPAWPLATLALWIWRKHWRAPHIALSIAGAVGAIVYLACGQTPGDTAMLMLVPPTLMLCAFGLPALRRGSANLIDWFALLAFSAFGIGLW